MTWINDFTLSPQKCIKASLHDATFIQNIIGFLLENILDQMLYHVDARKTLLDKSKNVVWR